MRRSVLTSLCCILLACGTSQRAHEHRDGGTPDALILSPLTGAQFYSFEDVPFRGACPEETQSARFVVEGAPPLELGPGLELTHRFEPGSYTVSLVCVDETGGERRVQIALTVHTPPSIVYAAQSEGKSDVSLYATALNALGQTTRISPESEGTRPNSRVSNYAYNDAGDRVYVGRNADIGREVDEMSDAAFAGRLSVVTPCREAACVGQERPYVDLLSAIEGCDPFEFKWSPDGYAAAVTMDCDDGTSPIYWVDLSGTEAQATLVPGYVPDDGSRFGRMDFSANGDVLLYGAGDELKAMDTRDPAHPVVSLGSIAGADWALSSARDRVVILGSKEAYTLQVTELISKGAAARVAIPFNHDIASVRGMIYPAGEHLIYGVKRITSKSDYTDFWMMRWDGSRDVQLCKDCINAAPVICGNHFILPLQDKPPFVGRIVEGESSDLETIMLAEGAPPASFPTFRADCSLLAYLTLESPVIADLSTGEWIETPFGSFSPNGAYFMEHHGGFSGTGQSYRPITRSPLGLGATALEWTPVGPADFSPDSKHLVFVGEYQGIYGAHIVNLESNEVFLIPDLLPQSFIFYDDHTLLAYTKTGHLSEVDLTTFTENWRTDEMTRPGYVSPRYVSVPNARAVAYDARLTADGLSYVYRSDLSGKTQRFGDAIHWDMSPDGTRLGTRDDQGLKLWSFDAAGTAAPLAEATLPSVDYAGFLSFEVSANGLLGSSSWEGLLWLSANGQSGTLPLPTGTIAEGTTRGTSDASRGLLAGDLGGLAQAWWLDFSNPSAPTISEQVVSGRLWYQSQDRRYQLRGEPAALQVFDFSVGQSRAVMPANETIPPPSSATFELKGLVASPEGLLAFMAGQDLFWLDLGSATLTAHEGWPNDQMMLVSVDATRALLCFWGWDPSDRERIRLATVTLNGERTVVYNDPEHPTTECPTAADVSPDGRWVHVSTPSGELIASMDKATPAVAFPANFHYRSFDRTSRYVLGVQAAPSFDPQSPTGQSSAENKISVLSLEHPEQITAVHPADFVVWDGEHPIWVP